MRCEKAGGTYSWVLVGLGWCMVFNNCSIATAGVEGVGLRTRLA